jgi:cytochrome P450
MLEYWTQRAQQSVRSTHKDTKIFTLNVLAAALFDKIYVFEGHDEDSSERHADDKSYMYRASLATILSSIIHIFIFGEKGLKAWWTPKSWKAAAEAMATFRSYILGLMSEERGYVKQGVTDRQHLVARLVRACEVNDANLAEEKTISSKVNMTEEEIISNLFIYAFAGNDTTAIALTTMIIHLAANPQTQDWIAEEIENHLPSTDAESWSYETFKKLKRCGAVVVRTPSIPTL